MAEARGCGLIPQFDIGQILLEAQHRWLRPAEICEILQNYQKFRISPEPPNKPPSGSLFLFDRKILRYFRKDGLNWRKKNDGKTVKEAHERLKAGSVDVLHCYYAHGEENKNFQRRSYWLLEENFMHIVLVHYLEVKGNRASCIHSEDVGETTQVSHMDSPVSSNSFTSQSLPSLITDTGSPDSAQMSEYENAESDNYQTRSRYHAFPELQQYEYGQLMDAPPLNHYVSAPYLNNQGGDGRSKATAPESDFCSVAQEDMASVFNETDLGLTFNEFKAHIDLASWNEVLEHCSTGYQSGSYQTSGASLQATTRDTPKRESLTLDEIFYEDLSFKQEDAFVIQRQSSWQSQLSNPEVGSLITSSIDVENDLPTERNINYPFLLKQQSSDLSNIEERLKKHDSFSRWMGKELGELDDPNVNISSGVSFSTVESQSFLEDSRMSIQDQMDEYLMSPLLSQEQLFNIIDFSPSWGYPNLETKVLITGTFLKNKMYVEKCKWSCMFGEVEVPAEVIADGTLRCHAPPHKSGRVPFYITCSNRVACSEVREFEYQENHNQDMETPDSYKSITNEMNLHIRFENLVSLESPRQPKLVSSSISRIPHSIDKDDLLMLEFDDEWFNILKLTNEKGISPNNATDQFPEKLLKEKLKMWLVDKVDDNSKALRILDKDGQGVIHLAAALGYDWAIQPTITAGVNINFRDTHGWTALHWAAFCGRERTVVSLIVLGADSGALTDPTLEFPSGRTPADLASGSGYKGIAGFLAESSLTTHLSLLTLKDSSESELAEHDNVVGVDDVAEKCVDHLADGDMQARLSLKDSLSAVQNAAQAAARIYQVFRVHSFHRKKLIEFGNKKCGISDERALSLVSLKTTKPGQNDMHAHAAAVRIQNKFRGWKGRKEFLIVRKRIVRIQAHVRGHQVRKHYKKIVWSVGIVEKAILRWRRKGIGLRCFQSDGLLTIQNQPKDDDYDILQEGRKQTEARLERALARVKSMVQYPEARDQYRRLLTVVTQLQKAKVTQERNLKESEETMEDDFMVEVEALLENDIILPAAW